jgi:hypothetical protein
MLEAALYDENGIRWHWGNGHPRQNFLASVGHKKPALQPGFQINGNIVSVMDANGNVVFQGQAIIDGNGDVLLAGANDRDIIVIPNDDGCSTMIDADTGNVFRQDAAIASSSSNPGDRA